MGKAWTDLDDADLRAVLVRFGVRPLIARHLVEDRDTEGARWRINDTIRQRKASRAEVS